MANHCAEVQGTQSLTPSHHPGTAIRYQRSCRHVSALLLWHTCQSGFHIQQKENILGLAFSEHTSFSLPFPPEETLGKGPCMCSVIQRGGLLTACGTPEWSPDGPYTREIPGANLDHLEETAGASPACLPRAAQPEICLSC